MMRNRYPHTSDPETLEAQRGAALAKSIAGMAVVCIIVGLASVTARDALRTDSPRAGETVVAHAAASAVASTAQGASLVASDGQHEPLHSDLNRVDDYQVTVHY